MANALANAMASGYERARNALADVRKRPGNALLDTTRGALMGVSTDVLGYPVDLATMAMRPFGYGVEQPVGGSDWLANHLTSPTGSPAEMAGRVATGMLTPGPEEMLRMAGMLPKNAMQELTVYHGSPHRINNVDEANPVGKFDLSKVGTGEGAQAYGHGVYLAEHPDVARGYATQGAWTPARRTFQGQEVLQGSPEFWVANLLDKTTVPALKKEIAGWIKDADSWDAARKASKSEQETLATYKKALEVLQGVKKKSDFGVIDGGHFYTVDLPDEHIAKMLDWDAPLSEQPESVRKAFADAGFNTEARKFKTPKQWASAGHKYLSGDDAVRLVNSDMDAAKDIYAARKAWNAGETAFMEYVTSPQGGWLRGVLTGAKDGDMSGGVAYQRLADKLGGFGAHTGQGGGQVAASEQLRSLGIPGIRYFDGGSRASGKGTRNFVIFDGDTAKILKRE